MIEFPTVSKEIRSLVSRRQELGTFLGSVFAASGIFLQNALGGNLPEGLASIEDHLFAYFSLMLMVPSLILALRVARLHGGMVLNGMLYARLLHDQDFTARGDVARASRHNFAGVSFLQFLLANLIAAFSTSVMALALGSGPALAIGCGVGVFVVWLALYFRFHHRAASIALRRIQAESCAPFTRNDWEEHISASLQDSNRELIVGIGFVGLITFSVFEVMSGLGGMKPHHALDLDLDLVRRVGPLVYTILMLTTCVLGLVTYLRLRVSVGRFSLLLDPTDRPFRPFVLTDSLLGYLLLSFFLATSVHLLLIQTSLGLSFPSVLAADLLTIAVAVSAEQATLVWAGRKAKA